MRNSEKKKPHVSSHPTAIKGAVSISLNKSRGGEQGGSGVPFPVQPNSGLGGSLETALCVLHWSTGEKRGKQQSERLLTLQTLLGCEPPGKGCSWPWHSPAWWEQHGTDHGRVAAGSGRTVPPVWGHRSTGSSLPASAQSSPWLFLSPPGLAGLLTVTDSGGSPNIRVPGLYFFIPLANITCAQITGPAPVPPLSKTCVHLVPSPSWL